ncbi:DnaJ C-terminal domain-containing protein [Leucobacter komagatae]|uniref:Molecular chaperone DnaJ n=1 Tax=Leucobacter komagatae TaxID=55969 RepID=A0A0D0H682_9MICO|nr:DnaJ C-terminal domain-containing protein [Leucobacter komagatae]KIP52665.1 molecular chaperone DnaJ [Leucobacter komagatae]
MASQDWLDKDFYRMLGVSKDVDDAELKKVYRKLARKYHPDSNPGDAAAEAKFKEISEAYSVLSDKEQRSEYDQIRAMGAGGARFTAGGQGGQGFEDVFGGMFGGAGGQGGRNTQYTFQQGGGYDDLFNMFGGGGARGPQKGRDVNATTTIDFETAVSGDTVTLQTSNGNVKVKIPAGVSNGQKIRLRGKGEPGQGGTPAGDLMLTVTVRKHPVFERDGLNLKLKLPVTFTEATLGATVEVPTLGGETVRLKVQPGTPSGRVLRVKGRGVKTSKGTGDLLAEVQVAVPSHLSEAAREALEAFQQVEPQENPREDLFARART